MTRSFAAFLLGAAFVGIVQVLGHFDQTAPVPYWLHLPGIAAGAFMPDSGFNPEGDTHPWGLISTFIVYVVDVAAYGGLAWLLLHPLRRRFLSSK